MGGRSQEGGNRQVDQDPRAPGLLDRDPIAPGLLERGKDSASQPDAPGKQGPADFWLRLSSFLLLLSAFKVFVKAFPSISEQARARGPPAPTYQFWEGSWERLGNSGDRLGDVLEALGAISENPLVRSWRAPGPVTNGTSQGSHSLEPSLMLNLS